MHKRIVDGGALWTSDKLATVNARYRAEYANLIPLATSNGTFDANPKKVHRLVYAYNRSDISVEQVAAILTAFEKAKMIFRWKENGKVWGYFVGIDVPGRLPSASHRKNEQIEVELPPDRLEKFLSAAKRNAAQSEPRELNEVIREPKAEPCAAQAQPKAEACVTQGQPKAVPCVTQGRSRVALALALDLERDVPRQPAPATPAPALAAPDTVSNAKTLLRENLFPDSSPDHPSQECSSAPAETPPPKAIAPKRDRATDAQAAELYKLYPRHDARAEGLKAFRAALERIAKREGLAVDKACEWMAERVRAFAAVQLAKPKEKHEFIPLPATWCNKERYDDEGLLPKPDAVWVDCEWDEAMTPEYQAQMADYHARHAGPVAGGGL